MADLSPASEIDPSTALDNSEVDLHEAKPDKSPSHAAESEGYHSAEENDDEDGEDLERQLRMPPRVKRYGTSAVQMRRNKANDFCAIDPDYKIHLDEDQTQEVEQWRWDFIRWGQWRDWGKNDIRERFISEELQYKLRRIFDFYPYEVSWACDLQP